MAPVGQGESVSAHVARILDVIGRSGMPYQLTPMGTILEGEWADVMGAVTACFETLAADANRVGVLLGARLTRRGASLSSIQDENSGGVRIESGDVIAEGCRALSDNVKLP